MAKDTGYVNATKLCKDGAKKFKHWIENKTSKELMNTLDSLLQKTELDFTHETNLEWRDPLAGIPADVCKCIQTSSATAEDCIISGSYIHPLLVLHLACWINPVFALKVGEIVNSFIVREYKDKLTATQEALRGANEEKEQLSSGLNYVEEK